MMLPPSAQADDRAQVQTDLEAKTASLQEVADEVNASDKKVAELDDAIDELLADIEDGQSERIELQKRISALSTVMYKNDDQFDLFAIITNSDSLADVLEKTELRRKVLVEYADLAAEQQELSAKLQVQYQEVSARKDEQTAELSSLKKRQEELATAVAELQARADELDESERALLAAAAEAVQDADDQMAADSDAAASDDSAKEGKSEDGSGSGEGESAQEQAVSSGWQSGLASAYGGSTDSGPDDPTATGSNVDDWSMGVAVPISWGPEAYYGRSVEISYGGTTVVATVVDCGDMGGGSRSLDLQPGVFKAFGFKSCDSWGVREVQYRFL